MKRPIVVLSLFLWICPLSVHAQRPSADPLPRGMRALAPSDIPRYEAAWTYVMDVVRTERASGREAALSRITSTLGFNATNAERFLIYSLDAEEDLRLFGANLMDELVCAKRSAFSTGREFGEALEERSRRYEDRKADLINGLAQVLDSESMEVFFERASVRNSRMAGLTADGAEVFDGAAAEEVDAALARVCNPPRN